MTRKTLLCLMLFAVAILPSHAVLKEADLASTLSILRQELTDYYSTLQAEAESHKTFRNQIISDLISISMRSNQSALMLYSQKPDYVFDLTYACNEVTNLYRDYHDKIMPFRSSINNIDIEIARYDSLVTNLNKMPVRSLSERAAIDRNVCLTLTVCIERTLKENRQNMSDYINIYQTTENQLSALNDYANLRYNEIQNSIFVNRGENYLSILSHLGNHLSKTTETVRDKYEPHQKVESQWDSRMIIWLFLTMGIFGLAAILVGYIGARFLIPKRLQTKGFIQKRSLIIITAAVLFFAVALQIIRVTWSQNFYIMASSLLTQYAWLLGVILLSLLARVEATQLRNALRIYAPLLVIGFIVITFRIILIPNELVNMVFPPLLLLCALWQWWVIRRYNHNIPRSDMFYTYLSLVVFIVAVGASWMGYTLMSVQLLIWWIMQLTCILTITCLRSWIKNYGHRHQFEDKPITESWFYDLLYSVLLPSLAVVSVLLSIFWAAAVFNLTEVTWKVFTYKFIESPNVTISVLNIAIVVILWMVFSYINRTAKALLKHHYMISDPISAESRFVMGKNIIQVLVWGLWLITCLAICHVDNTWLVVVSGGLSAGMGFASKDIIENIYYGLSLMAGRIKVGDWIVCDGIRGKVNSISYTSTMLEAIDGSVIAFQNSQLFNKNYKNMTKNHGYEMHLLNVGVAYGTDIDRCRQLLVEEVSKLDFIDKEHSVQVVLREFGDSSVNLQLLVWVPVLTQYVNDCEILECVYNTLKDNDISIPFPQRDLHIIRDMATDQALSSPA